MATKKLKEWERKNPRRPLTAEEISLREGAGLSYSGELAENNENLGDVNFNNDDASAVVVQIDERPDDLKEENPLKGLLSRAAQNLTGATPSKRGRPSKKTQASKANKEDVSTLLITLLTLGVSAWNVPQEVKPNDAEISAFSVPLTNILLRHVNLTGKLTQDALDVISMIAAGTAYYARTSNAWRALDDKKKNKNPIPATFDNINDDPFSRVTHNPEEVKADGNP